MRPDALLRLIRVQRGRRRYAADRRRAQASLIRVDDRPIPADPTEIRLFAKARNEATRLPYFLEHFRSLGVDRFFLIDNDSTDEFVSLALDQPDVHVFRTEMPLTAHVHWFELLLGAYGNGHWCVAADLDEALVLPKRFDGSLRSLGAALDAEGADALDAMLLDLYPADGVEATTYVSGDDPLDHIDHFDPHLEEDEWTTLNRRDHRVFTTRRYSGGPRKRVFDVDVNLTKVPFFRYRTSMWLSGGAHHLDGATMSAMRAVMLHFKYLHDVVARTNEGADRNVYVDGGGYYSRISERLRSEPDLTLRHEGSMQLCDLGQLEEFGLLRDLETGGHE